MNMSSKNEEVSMEQQQREILSQLKVKPKTENIRTSPVKIHTARKSMNNRVFSSNSFDILLTNLEKKLELKETEDSNRISVIVNQDKSIELKEKETETSECEVTSKSINNNAFPFISDDILTSQNLCPSNNQPDKPEEPMESSKLLNNLEKDFDDKERDHSNSSSSMSFEDPIEFDEKEIESSNDAMDVTISNIIMELSDDEETKTASEIGDQADSLSSDSKESGFKLKQVDIQLNDESSNKENEVQTPENRKRALENEVDDMPSPKQPKISSEDFIDITSSDSFKIITTPPINSDKLEPNNNSDDCQMIDESNDDVILQKDHLKEPFQDNLKPIVPSDPSITSCENLSVPNDGEVFKNILLEKERDEAKNMEDQSKEECAVLTEKETSNILDNKKLPEPDIEETSQNILSDEGRDDTSNMEDQCQISTFIDHTKDVPDSESLPEPEIIEVTKIYSFDEEKVGVKSIEVQTEKSLNLEKCNQEKGIETIFPVLTTNNSKNASNDASLPVTNVDEIAKSSSNKPNMSKSEMEVDSVSLKKDFDENKYDVLTASEIKNKIYDQIGANLLEQPLFHSLMKKCESLERSLRIYKEENVLLKQRINRAAITSANFERMKPTTRTVGVCVQLNPQRTRTVGVQVRIPYSQTKPPTPPTLPQTNIVKTYKKRAEEICFLKEHPKIPTTDLKPNILTKVKTMDELTTPQQSTMKLPILAHKPQTPLYKVGDSVIDLTADESDASKLGFKAIPIGVSKDGKVVPILQIIPNSNAAKTRDLLPRTMNATNTSNMTTYIVPNGNGSATLMMPNLNHNLAKNQQLSTLLLRMNTPGNNQHKLVNSLVPFSTSNTIVTSSGPNKVLNNTILNLPKQKAPIHIYGPLNHPAPLNFSSDLPMRPGILIKDIKPVLNLEKEAKSITLSWDMKSTTAFGEISDYELYAYQETSSPPHPNLWKKVGDVKALPLPMACTLNNFVSGYKYHFAVRAKYVSQRFGPFSNPDSIPL